jgi:hypothetical protein
VGNISNNIISGAIYNNNTGGYSISDNNAFTSESITGRIYGQEGYNYPQVNEVAKEGHLISSNGTDAVWTTIDDYAVATAPNASTDYLLMWSNTDGEHRKILLGDVGGAGGSGADGEITLWEGSPAGITSSPLFTYSTGFFDAAGYFRVGAITQSFGDTTFYVDGRSVFRSKGDANVWIKSSSNTAGDTGRLILNRRKGQEVTDTLPVLNDTIGEIFFNSAYSGQTVTANPSAAITVTAKENFVTNFGSSLSIKTTKIGQATMSERLLIDSDGTIKVTGQIYSTLPTLISPVANAIALDWNNGNGQAITLTGATGTVNVTLSNPKSGAVYLIKVTQSSTTARNITWPATVKWSGSVLPTITTTLNAIDTVALFYDGTNYYANISQNYG